MVDFFISIIKLLVAVLLIPLVLATGVSFYDHLMGYPLNISEFFVYGVLAFLLIFLFLYQFWGFYEFGQKLMGNLVKFTAPVDGIVAKAIPLYLIILLTAFYVMRNFLNVEDYNHYFMFFCGFLLCMHILLVAQELQEQEQTPVKPNYFLIMSFIIILLLIFSMSCLDFVLGQNNLGDFFKDIYRNAGIFYENVLKTLMYYTRSEYRLQIIPK